MVESMNPLVKSDIIDDFRTRLNLLIERFNSFAEGDIVVNDLTIGTLTGRLKAISGVVSAYQDNYISTTSPTASDDSSKGYSVGSAWINISQDDFYICVHDAVNAAIWLKIPENPSDIGAAADVHTHVLADIIDAGTVATHDADEFAAASHEHPNLAALDSANVFSVPQNVKASFGQIASKIVFRAEDRDGICASQTIGAAGYLTINGAYASGGVVDCSNGFQGPLTSGAIVSRGITLYSTGNLSTATITIYGLFVNADGSLSTTPVTTTGPNNETKTVSANCVRVDNIHSSATLGTAIEVGIGTTNAGFWLSSQYMYYSIEENAFGFTVYLPASLITAGYFSGIRLEILKYSSAQTVTWSPCSGVTLHSETLTTGGNSKFVAYAIVPRYPANGALKVMVSNAFSEA